MKYLLFITNAWHYLQQSDGTNLILWYLTQELKIGMGWVRARRTPVHHQRLGEALVAHSQRKDQWQQAAQLCLTIMNHKCACMGRSVWGKKMKVLVPCMTTVVT